MYVIIRGKLNTKEARNNLSWIPAENVRIEESAVSFVYKYTEPLPNWNLLRDVIDNIRDSNSVTTITIAV